MEQPENVSNRLFNSALDNKNILQIIVDNVAIPIVVINDQLNILYFNKKAGDCALELFREPITIGMNLWKFLPENRKEAAKRFREKLSSGQAVSALIKMTDHNRGVHWFNYNGIPVLDEEGKLDFIIVNCIDITSLKNIEQQVRESEEKYRSIVEIQSEMICKFRSDGTIIFVNPSYCNFFGVSEEEMTGTNFFMNIPELIRERAKQDITNLSKKNPSQHFREKITFDNGEECWISGTVTALFNQQGEIAEIQMVANDITEQQKIQSELIKAKEEAEEANRIRSVFMANISHEIRTPLNGLLGFSSILKATFYKNRTIDEYCTLIEESGQRLLNVMDDILEISAIGSKKSVLHNTNVYLPNIINDLFEYTKRVMHENNKHGLTVKTNVPPGGPNYLTVDGVRLYQVFMKLLGNAMKFTPSGEIEFGYIPVSHNTIRFYVRDTGIGIAPEKQGFIFEPFRQGDETIARNFGGNGIGLSIAKTLVEEMGSMLMLTSELGKGSNFYFDLLLNAAEKMEEVPSVKEVKPKKYAWGNKKILIVEDTYINYNLFKEFIKNTHAAILPAYTGLEALATVGEHPDIDLVLLDIRLPDIGGFEIARRIKKMRPGIKIIAQTAFASAKGQADAMKAGCDKYLVKPITREILLETIHNLLTQNQSSGT